MNVRVAYARAGGGVAIVTMAPKETLQRVLGPLTHDEYVRFLIRRCVPKDAIEIIVLSAQWEPPDSDRTFRNAWVLSHGKLGVDMLQARTLWRNRMREARAPRLAELDVAYARADEAADAGALADIVARKQRLRDVTSDPGIDAAATPNELRAVWPAVLT